MGCSFKPRASRAAVDVTIECVAVSKFPPSAEKATHRILVMAYAQ
jgi:hypothetical protein